MSFVTHATRLALGLAVAGLAATQVPSAQEGNRRQPNRDHYSRLAALPAQSTASALDAQRFPLAKWGDLYAWRLLKPHYVNVPVAAFTKVTVPANGSDQTRAELDYLFALQQSRIPEEQTWCDKLAGVYYHPLVVNPADPRFTANRDNLFFVGRGLGPWFTQGTLPKTTDLLARIHHDAMIQMVELKLHFARPRPHHLDPRIKASDERIPHGSFPSGHSFVSHVNAEVLARLAPARREALMGSALEMAWSRELLGVHFPSDSEAGRLFAQDFVRFLFENAAFRQDFEAVRQEWSRVASGS
jgi:acid phosphatase (class A)